MNEPKKIKLDEHRREEKKIVYSTSDFYVGFKEQRREKENKNNNNEKENEQKEKKEKSSNGNVSSTALD